MKEQFLNLTGLTELVGYLKTSIANHKEILPYASNKLFPSVGDINTIYINTATNTIYRWDSSSKTYITLAKAVKSVAISEATENGKITLTVDGNKTTVPIHGLGSAAYTNSSAYSPAGHTHTKAQVGLGNVDNTADATKSVKYAISAGSASSAAALTSNAGSSTQPVYFSGGKPVACSYTLGKSVPADALFTDHTYGNMKGATSSSAGSAGLVPAPNIGEQLKFLRADGTWVIPTNTTYSVGTTSYLGITKLYTETGSATDGTMTQNAITTALNGKSPTSHTHNYAGSSSSGGAADSAIKLNTSRNITIGNSTKSFDGTTNLSWSLNEIGIPTKSDIAACAVMYGGTTLSSSATVTDSAAQYKVISRSTGSTGDIFTKSVTLPKGLYSVMIRMKVSTISSSSNVFKLTIIDGSTTTTKYIKPNMFKAEDSYTTLGTAVENTSGTLKITLNVYSALSNQTVCVDYLAIAPTMVGVTSIA